MNTKYKYERPAARDFAELFETTGWNRAYQITEEELDSALDRSWQVIAAYDGEKLVGVGRVVSDGVLYAMIYDMIVHPSYQNRGIGTAILDQLLSQCDSAGIRAVQLFSAKGKAGYYRRFGFVERPEDAPGMILKRP